MSLSQTFAGRRLAFVTLVTRLFNCNPELKITSPRAAGQSLHFLQSRRTSPAQMQALASSRAVFSATTRGLRCVLCGATGVPSERGAPPPRTSRCQRALHRPHPTLRRDLNVKQLATAPERQVSRSTSKITPLITGPLPVAHTQQLDPFKVLQRQCEYGCYQGGPQGRQVCGDGPCGTSGFPEVSLLACAAAPGLSPSHSRVRELMDADRTSGLDAFPPKGWTGS